MLVHCIEAVSIKEIKKWIKDIVREKTEADEQQRLLETQMLTDIEDSKKTVNKGYASSFMSMFSNQTAE